MADRFDEIDEQLRNWITERVDVPDVSFDPPSDEVEGQGVSLFLWELADAPPPRTMKRTPLQLFLRYLVTTWAATPQKAHRMLGDLVLEAMEADPFELDLTAPEDTLWQSFGVMPRPSFTLQVRCRRERPRPEAGLVRKPLVLETAPIRQIIGRVEGPGGVPVPGASVEIPALNTRTLTDRRGRFQLDAVPQQSQPERLVVRAKGVKSETEVNMSANDDEPLAIQIDPEG